MNLGSNNAFSFSWDNAEVHVDIPYSAAGVSTTIVLTSKFTGKVMLLDVGDGALRALLKSVGPDIAKELDVIAISHGHFDHMGGLYTLLGFLRMLHRKEPLNILVPTGCSEVLSIVSSFRQSYSTTIPYRIFLHEVGNHAGFDTDFFKTKTFEVEHFGLESPSGEKRLMPALGFRVTIGQTVIGYTGDTRLCSGAEEVVQDVDLAIIEATRRSTPSSKVRVHLSLEEAQTLGRLAKDYILIHRLPVPETWNE